MSKYTFAKHGKGYMVRAYGEHIGNVERVTWRVQGSDHPGGWVPSVEGVQYAARPTRAKAAEELWELHRIKLNGRSS